MMGDSLFELSSKYNDLMGLLLSGEIDEDTFADTAESIHDVIELKADSYAWMVRDIEGRIDTIDKEIKRLQALKKTHTNAKARLYSMMEWALSALGKRELRTQTNWWKFRRSGGKQRMWVNENVDLSQLPQSYILTEYTIDKEAVRADLERGVDLPFAGLCERTETLRLS